MRRALLLALFLPSSVLAQQEVEPSSKPVFRRVQVYVFDDLEVTSDCPRPDALLIGGVDSVRHPSLMRVREDFRDRALDDLPQR